MKQAIFLSIKPEFTKLIETGEKNYEFRNYIPKKPINKLFVYESSPTSALKYIIELDKIIEYPDKIIELGYGNDDFNKGLKKTRYAYRIKNVYILERPLKLNELKQKYGFTAPQSYAYDDRYQELTNYLLKLNVSKCL